MSERDERHGRQAFWLTNAALAWSATLLGAAFMLPVYGSSATSSIGTRFSGSLTLVAVNGLHVLIPVAVPIVVSCLVWAALRHKCSHGSANAGHVAWVLVALLAAGCVVGIASIGLLVIPVVLLLGRAAAITPSATRLSNS